MKARTVLVGLVILAGALSTGALMLAPPLRLAMPQFFGMHCSVSVCVEDAADMELVKALVASARQTIEAETGVVVPPLTAVLCRTDACYRGFGGGTERAISFPFVGAVIAGRSWQDYIIRHEMIHWLQFEHFGAFETMRHPVWFREGMAYALSNAPTWDIPEAFIPWVAQYRQWQGDESLSEVLSDLPRFE